MLKVCTFPDAHVKSQLRNFVNTPRLRTCSVYFPLLLEWVHLMQTETDKGEREKRSDVLPGSPKQLICLVWRSFEACEQKNTVYMLLSVPEWRRALREEEEGGGSLRLDREHSVWESVRKKHRAQDKKRKAKNVRGHRATNLGYKSMRDTFPEVNNTFVVLCKYCFLSDCSGCSCSWPFRPIPPRQRDYTGTWAHLSPAAAN